MSEKLHWPLVTSLSLRPCGCHWYFLDFLSFCVQQSPWWGWEVSLLMSWVLVRQRFLFCFVLFCFAMSWMGGSEVRGTAGWSACSLQRLCKVVRGGENWRGGGVLSSSGAESACAAELSLKEWMMMNEWRTAGGCITSRYCLSEFAAPWRCVTLWWCHLQLSDVEMMFAL